MAFAVSAPLRDLAPAARQAPPPSYPQKIVPMKRFRVASGLERASRDTVVQRTAPPRPIPGPFVSFDGLASADNASRFGFYTLPPDTDGEIGPGHYLQIVNTLLQVFGRTGSALTPPIALSDIFSPLGTPCATRNDGDPIALYDQMADRWLVTQLCILPTPFTHQLIAISRTGDPTGAYFLYDYMMPNEKFNDYPKFGVWADAYYMSDLQFNFAGSAYLGSGALAFDRAKMLAGDPTARYVYIDIEDGNPAAGGFLPSDVDGYAPPPAGAPAYFVYFTADEYADPAHPYDSLRIYDFRPDFEDPSLSTFRERAESPILVAPFDPLNPDFRRDIEQPAPATRTQYLDSISDRLMFRLAYRNFGTHESLVVNHTVNVSGLTPSTPETHQAGIRYYELRRQLPEGAFFVQEQATFAPDAENRWMGSAAMDGSGNIAVGYSVSSLGTFPSVLYAGRLATDPPGGLFQGEGSLVSGTGVQLSGENRWGDYSAMSVDPQDDCAFWYTQQYYSAESQASSPAGWLTRIGAFTMPGCQARSTGRIQGSVTDASTSLPISGALVETTDGFLRFSGADGVYSMAVGAGTYDMRATVFGYEPAAVSGVSVSAAGTAFQDFPLIPIPVLEAAGQGSLEAESCEPASGGIDPAEAVVVSLPLRNVGFAPTGDLIATLIEAGGVASPGPPQSYGAVIAGGPPVARSFSFVADASCGEILTATLSLRDGARELGLARFAFNVGAPNPIPLRSEHSSGDLTAEIPDLDAIEVPISVAAAGLVDDVKARVRLNHSFDRDLILSLVGPDGTVVTLSNRRGGSGDNYGEGLASCDGRPAVFDDSAAAPISDGSPPFAGAFRPEQPLAAFAGKPAAGLWRLRVSDNSGLDVGTVHCFELEISRKVLGCCGIEGEPILAATGGSVAEEGCAPSNGAIDPGERVTVALSLGNAGSAATVELVATLLAAGGVQSPSEPQRYGALAPGASISRPFSFVAAGTCGDTLTATLRLRDGPDELGTAAFAFRLGESASAAYGPFSNPTFINVPAGAPAVTLGPAAPYPSEISISGLPGRVGRVVPRLSGVNHSFPDDLDILLVGPGGEDVLLMSDAGGGSALTDAALTFDDAAPAMPDAAPIESGSYRPSNYGAADGFPAPASAPPFFSTLSAFGGTDPNGIWRLFVLDDAGGDVGSIAGGWSLSIESRETVCCLCVPPAVAAPPRDAEGVFGGSAVFESSAMGTPAPTVQWQADEGAGFADLAGQTAETLRVEPLRLGLSGNRYRAVFRNGCGEAVSGAALLTVRPAAAISSVAVQPATSQYSDLVELEASVFPAGVLGERPAEAARFFVGLQPVGAESLVEAGGVLRASLPAVSLVEPVPLGTPPTGQMAPGDRTITAEFVGMNPNFDLRAATALLAIQPEEARTTYTGARFASTASPASGTAILTLSATVRDISATPDASGDLDAGDIRHAGVKFVDRGRGGEELCRAEAVGLVSSDGTSTGTATCEASVALGGAAEDTIAVGMVVDGYYLRDDGSEDSSVRVSRPSAGSSINGSGEIDTSRSAGRLAGGPGSTAELSVHARFRSGGARMRGQVQLTVRSVVGGAMRVYRIKSRALTSLAVQGAEGTATLNARASIQEITSPSAPQTLDASAMLQIVIADGGGRDAGDAVAVTVWSRTGGLWFASEWDGLRTVETVLARGNLLVR